MPLSVLKYKMSNYPIKQSTEYRAEVILRIHRIGSDSREERNTNKFSKEILVTMGCCFSFLSPQEGAIEGGLLPEPPKKKTITVLQIPGDVQTRWWFPKTINSLLPKTTSLIYGSIIIYTKSLTDMYTCKSLCYTSVKQFLSNSIIESALGQQPNMYSL